MSNYIPQNLRNTQEWFGEILRQRIDRTSKLPKIAPSGRLISEEAKEYIAPSKKLTSEQRLEIYFQQYWWRLLSALQEAYPLLCRLFGYTEFNELIAIPYLLKFPPSHWNINMIGAKIQHWIKEEYQGEDKFLIETSALIDWAFWECVFIEKKSSLQLTKEQVGDFLHEKITLQPHVRLFSFPFDLFSFRKIFLQQTVEHWLENDFPILPQEKEHYYFCLFRDLDGRIAWEEICEGEFLFLQELSKESSLHEICQSLEKKEYEIYFE